VSTGPDGKPRPWTHGYHTLPDGTVTPLHSHLGMIVAKDGTVYATILYPFTLLKMRVDDKSASTDASKSAALQYVDFALAACDRAEAGMDRFADAADVIAERHVAGGEIGFPFGRRR
jgi:hypothetical protein